MSKVERFWCHEARNVRCVREADYDALAAENNRLREALVEVMRVMPCLPSAAKQIDGMPDRYDAAIKSARAALADSKGGSDG